MLILALSLFLQAAAAVPGVTLRTFDTEKVGAPPTGFTFAAGREAAVDQWTVRRDGDARVLLHEAKAAPPDGFAVAVLTGSSFQDVSVSVRLKMTGGSRSAGLVWKYQDPLNHYSVQLDLARQEIAMYRVVSGNRIRIEREDDLELDPDAWHSLRVRQERGDIRVYLGGIRVFGERDRLPRAPAGVGLWCAGDATVMFDDFRVEDETDDAPRDRPGPSAKP